MPWPNRLLSEENKSEIGSIVPRHPQFGNRVYPRATFLKRDEIIEAADVGAITSLDDRLNNITVPCAVPGSIKQRVFTMTVGPVDDSDPRDEPFAAPKEYNSLRPCTKYASRKTCDEHDPDSWRQ